MANANDITNWAAAPGQQKIKTALRSALNTQHTVPCRSCAQSVSIYIRGDGSEATQACANCSTVHRAYTRPVAGDPSLCEIVFRA